MTEGREPDVCSAQLLCRSCLLLRRRSCVVCLQQAETAIYISTIMCGVLARLTCDLDELLDDALPALPCRS